MDEMMMKGVLVLAGLLNGLLGWVLKNAWAKIERQGRELEKMKLECSRCQGQTLEAIREQIDKRFDAIEELIDRRIEQGFTKIELTWVNEGRIPARSRKKPEEK